MAADNELIEALDTVDETPGKSKKGMATGILVGLIILSVGYITLISIYLIKKLAEFFFAKS